VVNVLLWFKKITKKGVRGISEIKATRCGVGAACFITKGHWSGEGGHRIRRLKDAI
jgi:hypothetical protein